MTNNNIVAPYSEMGCAVDIKGIKNGEVSNEASIALFYHIAKYYHNECRQLIWEALPEALEGHTNEIYCIHLASYGVYNPGDNITVGSDKNEIFAAKNNTLETTVNFDNTLIPPAFIKILDKLKKDGNILKGDGGTVVVKNFESGIYKG